jgi:hypothetical protein
MKQAIETDRTCEHFCYDHCMLTKDANYCRIVQRCDIRAEWCKRLGYK